MLELGPGTGQATVPLARRGLAVTAVELGSGLAAVLRRNVSAFPAVQVVNAALEEWDPPHTFDAVVAATAWHWLDPVVRRGGFTGVAVRRYERDLAYTTAEYRDLLLSYSGHRALDPTAREGLLGCIGELMDTRFGGRIAKRYLTELTVGFSGT